MPTLSLCLIARDNESELRRCLESMQGVFDEIIVVDTGSKDGTVEVAVSLGAKIFLFEWIDDFAAARNFSFSKATSDFIMWVDTDDVLTPDDLRKLKELKPSLSHAAYLMAYNYAPKPDGGFTIKFYRHRIVPNRAGIKWLHPIHECLNIPASLPQTTTDIVITHRRKAFDAPRNMRMLEKAVRDNPSDMRMAYYWGKELAESGRRAEALPVLERYLRIGGDWEQNMIDARYHMLLCLWELSVEDKEKQGVLLEEARKAVGLYPGRNEFWNILGQTHYNAALDGNNGAKWKEAIACFEIASRNKPPEVWGNVLSDEYGWKPWDRLCKCYSETGRMRDAYEANEKALALLPGNQRLLGNREFMRDCLFPARKSGKPVRLNIGAGEHEVDFYEGCDAFPGKAVSQVFSQDDMPYGDSTVHAIYSQHSLEHVGFAGCERTVEEWARTLRYGGDLALRVPDLAECCRQFAARESEWDLKTLYGSQIDAGQFHKNGFTAASLRTLLERHGFRIDMLKPYDGFGTPSLFAHANQLAKKPKVVWLVPAQVNEQYPALRIRCRNVDAWLRSKGLDSRVVAIDDPQGMEGADVAVLSTCGEDSASSAKRLREKGTAVVYDCCEDLEMPFQEEGYAQANRLVCCSTVLAEKFRKHGNTRAIFDAYEVDAHEVGPEAKHDYPAHGKDGRLRIAWCGTGGNACTVDFLRPIAAKLGMELTVISEWDNADLKWDEKTWLRDLCAHDVVVVPQRPVHMAKSNNRVTQAMSLGLPVLASPMRAYEEVVVHGRNGFICSAPEEWEKALTELRDEGRRREIGTAAKASVANYSMDVVGEEWLKIFEEACCDNCGLPRVDIIVPCWNNLECLKECVKSIETCTDWPYNIIVINSGTDGTAEWLAGRPDIIHWNSPTRLHFSHANNIGLKIGKEKFVMLLNDDTIVSRGWLSALMKEAMQPGVGAVGCLSNCDRFWLHNESIVVGGVDLVPGMTLDQIRPIMMPLYGYEFPRRGVRMDREWIAFYATLLPRAAIEKVGLLDESFLSGCEDRDYCARLKEAGYRIVQTWDSFVFHLGGSTRKNAEKTDKSLHASEDARNNALLAAKWAGKELKGNMLTVLGTPGVQGPTGVQGDGSKTLGEGDSGTEPLGDQTLGGKTPKEGDSGTRPPYGKLSSKPVIAFYTGGAWERWGPPSVNGGGIGGSETAVVHVASGFAKRGYDVWVFADCEGLEGEYEGVKWLRYDKVNEFVARNEMEMFVSSRRPEAFSLPIRANLKVCWVHDIFVDPNRNAHINRDKIDRFMCLSPWHQSFFSSHHGIPKDKILVTRNGIDLRRFAVPQERVKGRFIYSSSPDRGLDVLLELFPAIRLRVPGATLEVAYGFENWEKSLKSRNNPSEMAWMERIKFMLKQPGVHYCGRLGQEELAKEFLRAEIWGYPTFFTETFGITAIEAFAAGLPVVTSDLAALHTTVGDAGILLEGDPHDTNYRRWFVDECASLLTNKTKWEEYSEKGKKKAAGYSWDTLPDEWIKALGIKKPQGLVAQEKAIVPSPMTPKEGDATVKNGFLKTRSEVESCTERIRELGLVEHILACKDWDIANVVPRLKGRVLDMGCVESCVLENAARLGLEGAGIDLRCEPTSTPVLPVIEYVKGDMLHCPFPDASFDSITCLSVVEHGVDFKELARECSRLTKPGGKVFISFDYWDPKVATEDPNWNILDKVGVLSLVGAMQGERLVLTEPIDWTVGDQVICPSYYAPSRKAAYTFGLLEFSKTNQEKTCLQ